MNIEEIREFCIAKPGVTECFPFDETTLVFKVANKIFALMNLEGEQRINLKCNPEKAIELREKYSAIIPGFHMNKKHWNTIILDSNLSSKLIQELINHSYELIILSLPKKDRTLFLV